MLLAAVAALRDTVLPETVVDKNGVVSLVDDENEHEGKNDGDVSGSTAQRESLCAHSTNIPIPLTVGFIQQSNTDGDNCNPTSNKKETSLLLVDPTAMEEKLCDSTCCMVVNAGTGDICNVDLQGTISISSQQLARVAQMARGRAKELVDLMTTTN